MEQEQKKEEFSTSWWSFLFFGGFTLLCLFTGVWWGAIMFGIFALLCFPHKETHTKIIGFATSLWNGFVGLLIIGFVLILIIGGLWLGGKILGGIFGGSSSSSSYYSDYSNNEDAPRTIGYDEAIEGYWDDIQEYVDGTEIIEACYDYGNCYDLDADISSGYLDTLHFNNGGYLTFYAEFDENGNAYDTDDEGRDWEFTLDMSSSIVEDAVYEWASDNDVEIE